MSGQSKRDSQRSTVKREVAVGSFSVGRWNVSGMGNDLTVVLKYCFRGTYQVRLYSAASSGTGETAGESKS